MQKKIWIFLIVPVTAIVIVTGIFIVKRNAETNQVQGQHSGQFQEQNETELEEMENMQNMEIVAASGVTSIGTVNEDFSIDTLTVGMEVEEVLIESGDTVTSETAVLKFTEESVEEAREELESLLREADLAYRAGKIEYEQAKINAKYEYESTVLAGEQAQAVYEETIANLEENVDRTSEAYEETAAEIAELEAAIANNTYKTELDAAQAEWDTTYNSLVSKMEEWGIEWSEVTGGMSNGGMGNMNAGGDSTRSQYVSALKDLYSVLESNRKALTEAEEAYEAYVNGNTNIELQTLKLSLPGLEEAAASAKANYETSLVQAKLTMETSLTEAELAEKNYETNLEKAESDYETLKDAKEEAEENLAIFEAQMGDGYYYPTEVGTVLRVSVRTGREITGGSSIFTPSDAEEMTVTVSVDQADIAKLKVGDSAFVQSESSGMCQGVIRAINPVSASSSRSSITYSVTVELTGNYNSLSANESVSVYFTVGGSDGE